MSGSRKLLLISFDAVSSKDIKILLKMPNFSSLAKKGTLITGVRSVFVSNTYPAHASVITGVHPNKHGVIDNTLYQPHFSVPDWRWTHSHIKSGVSTLYGEAKKSGKTVCSILWPVSGGADINWNIPEIFQVRKSQNQLLMSLKNGSVLFQLGALLRHGKHLFSFSQPGLDDFACSAAVDAIKNKKPDLLMLHLSDVDNTKHVHGPDGDDAHEALDRQDLRLGRLLDALRAAGLEEHTDIIIFGDHAALSVGKSANLNDYFKKFHGKAGFHQVGGTAFLKVEHPDDAELMASVGQTFAAMVKDKNSGILRPLTPEEMEISGFSGEYLLGVEAKPGFWFGTGEKKGQHGYSLKQNAYTTFYLAAGLGIRENTTLSGGSIVDICPLAASLMGLSPWSMDGTARIPVDMGLRASSTPDDSDGSKAPVSPV